MRGGVNYYDLLNYYTSDDRDAMYAVIKENIEASKESQTPIL
jgi:hypothetical protein